MVVFDCNAITSAVTILPNGKIAPCCVIKDDYSKPIKLINNKDRFSDLQINRIPGPCTQCTQYPENSYKNNFNQFFGDSIQYLDFRNSNICNLKCRTCGPHFSSSWAKELKISQPIVHTDVTDDIQKILNENIKTIYFAGGEPLLNKDHWLLLQSIIDLDLAKNITIIYSTNLTVTTYKNHDVFALWNNYKKVHVMVSVDAIGEPFNYIRSGANWETVDKNINNIVQQKSTIDVSLSLTLSAISVWFLPDVLHYAEQHKIKVNIIQLTDPHYFTLNVFPTELSTRCIDILTNCKQIYPSYTKELDLAISIAKNNDDQGSFLTLVTNILLADKIRSEALFDLLPFKDVAIKKVFAHQ